MDKLKLYSNFVMQQLWIRRTFIVVYSLTWIGMSLMFATVFPFMRDSAEEITPILEAFPPGLTAAFNIQADFFTSAEAFIGGELLSFLLVVSGITFSILGVSVLGGQMNNRIIFVYLTKPIPRIHLSILQFINNQITNVITTLTIIAGLWISFRVVVPDDSIDPKFLLALTISLLGLNVFFSGMGQLIGVVLKYQPAMMAGIGIGLFSFILSGLSAIEGFPVLLKFFTPFYYIDLQTLTNHFGVDQEGVWSLCLVGLIFLVAASFAFRRKQIYVQ